MDLCLRHHLYEQRATKRTTQRPGYIKEETGSGLCHEAWARERVPRREANQCGETGCDKVESGDPHRREGPIGALLDTERQIHPQILIRELDISRQRKQRRNRARLEQEDLTRGINRPLDILGSAKMRLDLCSKLCQGMDLQIRKANFSARVWMLNTPGASIDYYLDDRALVAQATFDDLTVDSIHDKVVRIGRAGNDGFTQAGIGINHDLSALASKRVGSEEHPGSRSLHHPLDDDCHPHSSRIETRACAIHHSAVGPQ